MRYKSQKCFYDNRLPLVKLVLLFKPQSLRKVIFIISKLEILQPFKKANCYADPQVKDLATSGRVARAAKKPDEYSKRSCFKQNLAGFFRRKPSPLRGDSFGESFLLYINRVF